MPTNKNQLRAEAVELAALINKVLGKVKNRDYYIEQMYKSIVEIGANITSLRNPRDEIGIIRRLNMAIDACSEILFIAKVISVEGHISDDEYKLIKKSVQALERRLTAGLSD